MNRSYRNTRQNNVQTTNFVSGGFTQVGKQQYERNIQEVPQSVPVPAPKLAPVQPAPAMVQEQLAPMATDGENGGQEKVKVVKFNARSGKVSAKLRRTRANRRLRKLLCPKTAVMALHELRNKDVDINFKVSDSPINGQFKAETIYEGKEYTGWGAGKQAARNNVAEQILRDMVIERMKKQKKKSGTETQVKKDVDSDGGGDVEMTDAAGGEDEEEVPMTHLASYALHKLFAEWAKEGFEVPDFRTPGTPGADPVVSPQQPKQAKEAKIRTELPTAAEKLHPAMLLQIMRPGTQYQDLGSQGTTPNIIHAIGVTVDGQQYIGNGKSKKIARKEAARIACETLFEVKFDDEALNGSCGN